MVGVWELSKEGGITNVRDGGEENDGLNIGEGFFAGGKSIF